jgi:hypothetical protein
MVHIPHTSQIEIAMRYSIDTEVCTEARWSSVDLYHDKGIA